MKKIVFSLSFIFLAISVLSATAFAQPDPTGRGRYTQVGPERPYPGAKVIQDLPAGAVCAPADELIGSRVWNSTRRGKANFVELSEKAKVAVTPQGIFLCECMAGYNQIFLLENKQEKAPPAAVAQQQGQGVNVVVKNKITAAKGDTGPTGPQGPAGPGCSTSNVQAPDGTNVAVIVCGNGPTATTSQVRDGKDGAPGQPGKNGFCSGKLCKGLVIGGTGAAVGVSLACAFGFKGLCRAKVGPVVTTGGVTP